MRCPVGVHRLLDVGPLARGRVCHGPHPLGYGDLTPISDLGRMLAVTEAIAGQLYLVSAVALLVGNLGRTRTEAAPPAANRPLSRRARGQ